MPNPRYKNGNLRRKFRARFQAMAAPCAICGRPIRYDQPSGPGYPLSFVIDEIHPVSRYREFGYESREAAAQDWDNLQPAHYICNALKGRHTMRELEQKGDKKGKMIRVPDGEW